MSIRPIQYDDYDKISDDVLSLGGGLYLRMNVSLSDKAYKSGQRPRRYHFHKEFKYSSKYSDGKLISIRRSFMYFLSFDKISTNDTVSIMVLPSDMILLKQTLEIASTWFNNDAGVFMVRDGILKTKKNYNPLIVSGLAQNRYLQFEPVAITWENNGDQTPGIRITLNHPSVYVDVPVSKFMALVYTISTFNMYQSAQNLINYMGRPEFGFNVYDRDNDSRYQEQEDSLGGAKPRTLPKRGQSFFDKMNDLLDDQ